MAKKVLDVVDINFNQKHKIEVNTEDLPAPELSAEELVSKMEGDTEEAGVNVDLSEDGEKVKITLDQDVKDAISGNNTVEITITEDDWDEDEGAYVKRIELNNTFIKINIMENLEHEGTNFIIYNPYFKGFNETPINEIITGFSGLTYPPNERAIYFDKSNITERNCGIIAVFNGIVCTAIQDY